MIPVLLSFRRCKVDLNQKEVTFRNGQRRSISRLQADLLRYLAQSPGIPVTRDDLLTHVWKVDPSRTLTRTVDMHVSQLRRKLGDDLDDPKILITVHGRGYALEPQALL